MQVAQFSHDVSEIIIKHKNSMHVPNFYPLDELSRPASAEPLRKHCGKKEYCWLARGICVTSNDDIMDPGRRRMDMAHNGTGMMSEALADASMAMAPWLQKGDIHATRTGDRYGPPKGRYPKVRGCWEGMATNWWDRKSSKWCCHSPVTEMCFFWLL